MTVVSHPLLDSFVRPDRGEKGAPSPPPVVLLDPALAPVCQALFYLLGIKQYTTNKNYRPCGIVILAESHMLSKFHSKTYSTSEVSVKCEP